MIYLLFSLIIFFVLLYILLRFFEHLIIISVHKLLMNFFHDFIFEYNWFKKSLFTVHSLQCKSSFLTIDVQNLQIKIHPIQIFYKIFNHKPFSLLQITSDKLYISLEKNELKKYMQYLKDQKKNKKEIDKGKKEKNQLDKWIYIQILTYFIIYILKNASIYLKNTKLTIGNASLLINIFLIQFSRKPLDVSLLVKILGMSLIIKENEDVYNKIAEIPKFSLILNSTIQLVPYIITKSFDCLNFKHEFLSIIYNNSKLIINFKSIKVISPSDEEVQCNISLPQIKILFFKDNLYTKSLFLNVSSIDWSLNHFSSGKVELIRNDYHILNIENLHFSKGLMNLSPIEVTISLSLIIDISTIKRKFIKNNEKNSNPNILKKLTFIAPSAIFNLFLSDAHKIQFKINRPRIKNMILIARSFTTNIIFPNESHRVVTAHVCELAFFKPMFTLKVEKCEVVMTVAFPENDFFKEIFEIFSYIDRQYRGISQAERDLEPPTRRIMSLEAKHATFIIENFPLTEKIKNAQEAKMCAMEQLLMRQAKAVKIIQALKRQSIKSINEDSFHNESKKILFQQFKSNIDEINHTLSSISESNENDLYAASENKMERSYLCLADGKNIVITLNGPSTKDKSEALSQIKNNFGKISNENFGKISGGPITILAQYIYLRLPNLSHVVKFEGINLNGFFYNAKQNGSKKSDFYFSRTYCDSNIIDIPLISSRSIIFVQLNGNLQKAYLKYSPAILEFFQDNKIATSIMRKHKFLFTRIGFFDLCRIGFRFHIDFDIREFIFAYNNSRYAYSTDNHTLLSYKNCKFTVINGEFKIIAQNLILKILTINGYQTVADFPDPHLSFFMPSKNEKNLSGQKPFIIPIDSRKMMDKSYDPYTSFRTQKYGSILKISFGNSKYLGNKVAFIDGDLLLFFYKQNFLKHSKLEQFVTPPHFALRFQPRVFYEFTEIDIILPSITISYSSNSVSLKLFGSSINQSDSNILHLNIKIDHQRKSLDVMLDSPSFSFDLNAFSFHLISITLKEFSYKLHNHKHEILATIGYLDFSTKILNFLHIFKSLFYNDFTHISKTEYNKTENNPDESNIKENIIDKKSIEEIYTFFPKNVLKLIIPEILIEIKMKGAILKSTLLGGSIEIRKIPNEEAKTIIISIDDIIFSNFAGFKLLEIISLQMCHCFTKNKMLDMIEISSLRCFLKSDDIDFFKSSFYSLKTKIVQFLNSSHDENNKSNEDENPANINKKSLVNQKEKIAKENKQIIIVQEASVCFMQDERNSLLTIKTQKLLGSRHQQIDGTITSIAKIYQFEVKHDLGKDSFKDIVDNSMCDSKQPFLTIVLVQAPLKMKFPVFQKIELYMSYFSLRISLPFIQEFKNFFPTSEAIEILDLEQESEIEDFESEDENEELEFNENSDEDTPIIIAREENEGNSVFIQEFILHSFKADLSLKRKFGGVFSEFLNRPLNFNELVRYDICGSRKQILYFVRRTFTRTAIMSLPKMLFSRTKTIPTTDPNNNQNSQSKH